MNLTNKKEAVINVRWLRRLSQADKKCPKVTPRTMTEARSRLCEIIGISGIDESDDTQYVLMILILFIVQASQLHYSWKSQKRLTENFMG